MVRHGWFTFLRPALICTALLFTTHEAGAQTPTPEYKPGEVIIKFRAGATTQDRQAILDDLGAQTLHLLSSIGAEHLRITQASVEQAVARYVAHPDVAYIEPNFILRPDVLPNDPQFPSLWGMRNVGQTGGTPGADIRAANAWDVFTGTSDVLIAIIDTGVDYNHPDLAANIFVNPGEIPANGIDDDGNGFVDDVRGWDFAIGDNNPMDEDGHGTHVAGTCGAVGNNGIGVAGVNWQVRLLPIRFLSPFGTTEAAILSIDYAVLMGADVINASWGGGDYSEALREAILRAGEARITFVAAAGNNGLNTDLFPHYPSSYDAPNLVAVAATDHNDLLAGFSNYGVTTVDLAAPGVDILSTFPGSNYGSISGTSMATPHVAGAMALIYGRNPGISALAAKNVLLNRVDDLPSLVGRVLTGGRLNAFMAIAEADTIPPGTISDLSIILVEGSRLEIGWTATGDDGGVGRASRYEARYSMLPITEANFATATAVPDPPNPLPAGSAQTLNVAGLAFSTTYHVALRAFDEFDNAGPISNVVQGTTLGPPDIGVTPGSLSADLLTGQTAMRTLTVSNTGVSELLFEADVVAPPGAPLKMDVITSDGRSSESVLATGRPVALERLDRESRSFPVALAVGAEIDRAGNVTAVSSEPGGRLLADSEEVFGSTQNQFFAGPRTRGNIFECTTARTLREHRLFMDPSTSTQLWFLVYEGLASVGTYDLVSASNTTPSGPGLGWYSSGPVDVDMVPGRFYLIVASFEAPTVYFNQLSISPYPIPATFGSLVAAAGWTWAPIPAFPPASSETVPPEAFLEPVAYYQTLITGDAVTWLSLEPDTAGVAAGASLDLTVTFDATGMYGGDYDANLRITSNDPDEPEVLIPANLHVTGAPDIALSTGAIDFGSVFVGSERTETLYVINTGTDVLHVTGASISPPDFLAPVTGFDLPPGDSLAIPIIYRPGAPVSSNGSFVVLSDDPDAPEVVVALSGTGLIPPDIGVTPASLSADLLTGEQATRTLTLENTGGSDLFFTVSPAGPAGPAPGTTTGPDAQYSAGDPVVNTTPHGEPDGRPLVLAVPRPQLNAGSVLVIADGGTEGDVSTVLAGAGYVVTQVVDDAFWDGTNPSPQGFGAVVLLDGVDYGDDMPLGGQQALMDYVSQGGGLILTEWIAFEVQNGRYGSMLPLVPMTRYSGFSGSFTYDVVQDHPVTAGVSSSFSVASALSSGYPNSGTALVSRREDGSSAVVAKEHQQGRIVQIALAGNYDGHRPFTTPDVQRLLVNGADWVSHGTWLGVTPASGTVPAGGQVDLEVRFDAAGLFGGDYEMNVTIASNDPDEAEVIIPAQLHVTGAPDIAVSVTAIDYGNVFVGYARSETVVVRNVGTDMLHVTGLSITPPDFSAPGDGFDLAPNGSRVVIVTYGPGSAGPRAGTLTVHSDDPDEAELVVTLAGTGLIPPDIGVSPTSLSADLISGQEETRTLTIENTGGSDLTFSVAAANPAPPAPPAQPITLAKGQPDPRRGAPVTDGRGGPDVFGYRWIDSDEAGGPVFDWVEISGIGTPLPYFGDDWNSGPLPIGFSVPYYGQNFSTVNVCSNGWISFTSPSAQFGAYPLPNPNAPENMLAAFWADLYTDPNEVYYHSDGTRLIVEYRNVTYLGGGPPFTFQIVLYPNGRVLYQYLDMGGTQTFGSVGFQNATRDDGLTIAFNTPYVRGGLAIQIANVPPWLSVTPAAGTVPAGGRLDLEVGINSTGLLGGDYEGVVAIASNDPDELQVTVPVQLHVTGVPDISVSRSSVDFGDVFLGIAKPETLIVRNVGTDALVVTALEALPADYTVNPAAGFTLAPGVSRLVAVTFAPTVAGPRPGSLTMLSNDPDTPEASVTLAGTGLIPPDIAVSPDSLSESLLTGQMVTRSLTIENSGPSDLIWEVRIRRGPEGIPASSSNAFTAGVVERRVRTGAPFKIEDTGNRSDAAPVGYQPVVSTASLGPAATTLIVQDFLPWGSSANQTLLSANNIIYDLIPSSALATTDLHRYRLVIVPSDQPTSFYMAVEQRAVQLNDYVAQGGVLEFHAAGWGWAVGDASLVTLPGGMRINQYSSGQNYVLEPGHPLMQGVPNPFTGTSASHSFFTSIPVNATQIATDDQGRTNLVVYGVGSGMVVAGCQTFEFGYNNAQHSGIILSNMIPFAYEVLPDWLSLTPVAGTVVPGGRVDLAVTLDATGLLGGDYRADIVVHNNDPDESEVSVPVHMHVTGAPDIALSVDAIDYGNVFIGYARSETLVVRNTGTDLLTVSALSMSRAEYTVVPSAGFTLVPGASRVALITFRPTGAGARPGTMTVRSDDPDEPEVVVTLAGTGLFPPDIGVSPTSLSVNLIRGQQETRTLTIENTGGSDLTFGVTTANSAPPAPPAQPITLAKGQSDPRRGAPVTDGRGGPDVFGYRWIDSDETGGPVFDWVEISGIGTPLPYFGDDWNSGTLPIGFTFSYYGQNFTTFQVCSNGWISFTSSSAQFVAYPLPNPNAPENMLAAFWADLYTDPNEVYYHSDGTRLIVEYRNVTYLGGGPPFTFQIVLYPNGRVLYQYLDMGGTQTFGSVGFQNATRDDGLTIAFNTPYVRNGLAIQIANVPPWLSVTPAAGTVPAGSQLDLEVRFDATELSVGAYEGVVAITSNDPDELQVTVPAHLTVDLRPDIAGDPRDFGSVYVGRSRLESVVLRNEGALPLTITGMTTTGDFALEGTPTPPDVPPGGALSVPVRFAPSAGCEPCTGSLIVSSNDPDENPFTLPLTGIGVVPPEIGLAPSTLHVALAPALGPPATMTSRVVTVGNSGGSVLNGRAIPVRLASPPGPRVAATGPGSGGLGGGPDGAGYTWIDSDEPGGLVFEWVDIAQGVNRLPLTGNDNVVTGVPIGFDFPFYGGSFDAVNVSTNGWLSFTSALLPGSTPFALPSADPQAPRHLVAPFWENLTFGTIQRAYAFRDPERFVVSYVGVATLPLTGAYTFQTILHADGRIVFQYLNVPIPAPSLGSIGIQNGDGTVGLTVSYGASYVHRRHAVEITPGVSWLRVVPGVFEVQAGENLPLGVLFDAVELGDGDHQALVRLTSNDLETPVVDVPVTVHVGAIAAAFTVNLRCDDDGGHEALVGDDDDDDGGGGGGDDDDDDGGGQDDDDDGGQHDDDDDGGRDDDDDDGPARWVRGVITLPAGYDPQQVVLSSVLAAGSVPVSTTKGPRIRGQKLKVWFDRAALLAVLPDGDAVPVTVIGEIDGQTWFQGTATACLHRPNCGGVAAEYQAGSPVPLNWSDPPGMTATAFDVWFSADAGETWSPVARGLTARSVTWVVPNVATTEGMLGLVAFGPLGPTGSWRSEVFRITGATADVVAARGLPGAFGLRLAGPNPSREGAALELGLPTRETVAIAVYDVRGARVRSYPAREFEAGWHRVSWDGRGDDGRRLGAGVYFVRGTAGSNNVTVRVALIR